MLKTEFCKEITVGEVVALNESVGLVVELNDGEVTTAYFEEAKV